MLQLLSTLGRSNFSLTRRGFWSCQLVFIIPAQIGELWASVSGQGQMGSKHGEDRNRGFAEGISLGSKSAVDEGSYVPGREKEREREREREKGEKKRE